jgi:hypothetical protein
MEAQTDPVAYHPLYQGIWSSRHLDGAPFEEKAFFVYLFSNDHVRPSGIYRVKDAHIQAETELPMRRIRLYLADLQTRGRIIRDDAWLFVVGYFDRQPKQPNLLNGVKADIASCTSIPILTAWGQRYPHHSQWSTHRLAMVGQRSTDPSRDRAVTAVSTSTTLLSKSEHVESENLRQPGGDLTTLPQPPTSPDVAIAPSDSKRPKPRKGHFNDLVASLRRQHPDWPLDQLESAAIQHYYHP